MQITTQVRRFLSDTFTPVSVYMKLRDHFSSVVLLESTDFRSRENCYSFLGIEPIATFRVEQGVVTTAYPNDVPQVQTLANPQDVPQLFERFIKGFDVQYNTDYQGFNGFFGHTNFDAIQYFDTIKLDPTKRKMELPEINYSLYRYIIAFNHFNDELDLLENLAEGMTPNLDRLETLMYSWNFGTYRFETVGAETSNLSDAEYKASVRLGKHHCQVGDVFQIVPSRQFQQRFKGDDFNVYRVLRSINPSPYLFYFDYGSYKILGSSPEAQIVIENDTATILPIAGTYKRTGNDEEDRQNAAALAQDPKEVAEHIMLVDLARNDLSRHAKDVHVEKLKEIQFFSHVIHLVSKVKGNLLPDTNPIRVFGDTFPAGTLAGAPKYKAIELISGFENQNRGIYGGAIGLINFNGDMNHAIIIRSFLSKDNTLFYQAGAGVIAVSDEEKELQEVNNKLRALKNAIVKAVTI
jgi:anthranilate synthase component I